MYINSLDQLIAGAEASLKHSINLLEMPTAVNVNYDITTVDSLTIGKLTEAIGFLRKCQFDRALTCIELCSDYTGKGGDIDAVKRCKYYNVKNAVVTGAVSFTVSSLLILAVRIIMSMLLYKTDPSTANSNVRKYGMMCVKVADSYPTSFIELVKRFKNELRK